MANSKRIEKKSKNRIRGAIGRLMAAVDIPPVSAGLESRIEMCGRRRIAIDGCTGVNEYNREELRLTLCDGEIRICGENMLLSKYGEGRVSMEGMILSVSFEFSLGTDGGND